MKTFLLVSVLMLSVSAMADSLHCKGMDSRLVITGADKYHEDDVATVEVWSREYEQANHADVFHGFSEHATVKELMAKKVIKATSMHGTFKLDLDKKLMTVTSRGRTLKNEVICQYRK